MRSDVLDVISSARDVTNAVILTHNIDFVFVQTVVLSAFRRCGYPTITIFADSGCAAETFAQQKAVVTDLGLRYRVVRVAMGTGFRFHPKAVLLTGAESGTLLVGSGNLTFGGWRENGEVWTHLKSETDGAGPFHAFRNYLADVLKRVVLPEAVEREVDEAFDPSTRSWLSADATDNAGVLLGRAGNGPPLVEQMVAAGGAEPVEELLVCAPYFDHDGIALQELVARVGAHRTAVLCQVGQTKLHERAWKPNAAKATLQRIDFQHGEAAGRERSAFVHAKFYGLRRADEVVVLAGSANCSRAALTVGGDVGNAELMVARSLTPQAFEEEFLDELDISPKPVVLSEEPPYHAEAADGATLRILAARFEAGGLLVGYAPSSAMAAECLVDGATTPFVTTEEGIVRISCPSEPKLVTLRGWVDGVAVESEPTWIDLERRLRATVHSRSLADSFRARVQAGAWGADGWAEVLDVFCKHLTYMPAVRPGVAAPRADGGVESDAQPFTAADVFGRNYKAPKLDRVRIPSEVGGDGQVHSLQQLLLRWFGVEPDEPEEESDADNDNDGADGDEAVDRPERLPTTRPSDEAMTDRNRRRIARIVDQMEAGMTSPEFLLARSPDYLATDLKVASALLCAGLGKGWIEHERFFEFTHSIWTALFFASEDGKEGWLEYRAGVSEDRDAFVRNMRSADLSAALIGWYLTALTPGDGSFEAMRFAVAAALAVARLPWLWHGGTQEEIEKELAVLLRHTAEGGMVREERIGWAEAEWKRLTQRGQALGCLEATVRGTSLGALRDRIEIDELTPGDVLWQGTAGFCVVTRRCSRSGGEYVPVLKLQGQEAGKSEFSASATVPVRALLDEEVIPWTPDFGDGPRRVLREFIGELSSDMLRQF